MEKDRLAAAAPRPDAFPDHVVIEPEFCPALLALNNHCLILCSDLHDVYFRMETRHLVEIKAVSHEKSVIQRETDVIGVEHHFSPELLVDQRTNLQ